MKQTNLHEVAACVVSAVVKGTVARGHVGPQLTHGWVAGTHGHAAAPLALGAVHCALQTRPGGEGDRAGVAARGSRRAVEVVALFEDGGSKRFRLGDDGAFLRVALARVKVSVERDGLADEE